MAGIYLHIPFCRKVCYYCDFFFTISLKQQDRFVDCVKKELLLQKSYLQEEIETIYFGGGTPSVINAEVIQEIIELIGKNYSVTNAPEITLEANPDDLTKDYLQKLQKTGVNRLSIGVQSFFDEDLIWMNRRHSGKEALHSIRNSQEAGFENLNVDLIYGFPLLSDEKWKKNIGRLIDLNVPHISSYLLGIEPKTVFGVLKEKGKLDIADDEQCVRQFFILTEMTENSEYRHYEISNFCKPGFFSQHNTAYWLSKKYLGLGPSANSYDGKSRQWNVRLLEKYLSSIEKGLVPFEKELLGVNQKYNDYILTSLRTMWGTDLGYIEKTFGEIFLLHFEREADRFIKNEDIKMEGKNFRLTKKGMTISDTIISTLLYV